MVRPLLRHYALVEQKFKYRQKARYQQSIASTQQLDSELEIALQEILKSLPGSEFSSTVVIDLEEMENAAPIPLAGLTATLQQNAKRVGIKPKGPDCRDVIELNEIVEEMIYHLHGDDAGVQLAQGADGLYSPFLADLAIKFNYKRAVSIFTERELRTKFVCNAGKVGDRNQSWRTHYLTSCYFVLKNRGSCGLTGLPLTSEARMPNRMSFGHIQHHENMLSGWSSPRPTTFAQFNPVKVNVQPESWAANALKSDAPQEWIEEYRKLCLEWIVTCRKKAAFWLISEADIPSLISAN
ncbi:hypothetical protein NliqN6_4985 [Naganishia liquefaciens]|uniref:Uncharacterized protein n=1 Tax=Naganishia liquefaciens TaxID=104408 RepID=A0A8H3YGR8_9TREE|nr:hypothetical protein NliqN6_4985 [Naganishia liquefaciens]